MDHSTPKSDGGLRPLSVEEQHRLEAADHIVDALKALGVWDHLDGESRQNTPLRVARAWGEFYSGCFCDPARHLDRWFDPEGQEIVLVKDIPFVSNCAHHLVPFIGKAHVAYIPNERMAGISKFARLVEEFGRRPQVQEKLTTQVADLIDEKLQPIAVAVVIEAEHLCMTTRGVMKPGAKTVTSAMRGLFHEDPKARQEVLALIDAGRDR
jgi:GTP cyclohydrolase I